MEGFVIDVERELEGGEAEVGGCEEEEEEGSLEVASALSCWNNGRDQGGLVWGAYRRREVGCAWCWIGFLGGVG